MWMTTNGLRFPIQVISFKCDQIETQVAYLDRLQILPEAL